jgi:large subunit ribosomal protein L6
MSLVKKASAENYSVRSGKTMSRIGNAIITVPKDVTITKGGNSVVVKGLKGELSLAIPSGLSVDVTGAEIHVVCKNNDKSKRALHGYFRATLANAIAGVGAGWTKTLELSGVGYRASLSGANLVLTIGFSHPVTIVPPQGITFSVNEGKILISGIDRQAVGQIAASIREIKKPEPYKGKGIKYEGEHIRKKAGKAKAVGTTTGGAK